MNPSTTAITLNMQLPNIATVAWAVQGDQLSRQIEATLVDGSTAWNPQAGYHGVVRYNKPDGTAGVYDVDEDGNPAVTWVGNVATIKIVQQALTVAGTVIMQLEFYDSNDERITAFGWANNVQPSAVTDTEFISTDYYNILTLQIAAILGSSGHPPYINSSNKNWMIWDENSNAYVDSGFSSLGSEGPEGPQGVSITSVTKASGTGAPGTTDVYNVNLSNSTVAGTFNVYNGQDGLGSPGTSLPLMDGTATVGTANAYSREDHVHPSDANLDAKIPLAPYKNKKYILIGDSYMGLGLGAQIISITGIDALTFAAGGGGFVGQSGTYTFLTGLQYLASSMTEDEKAAITDVYVLGGWNDYAEQAQDIATAMATFDTYVKATFPSAHITVGVVSYAARWRTGGATDLALIENNVIVTYSYQAKVLGWGYIPHANSGIHFPSALNTDGTHPYTTQRIAEYVAQYITSGRAYYNSRLENAVVGYNNAISSGGMTLQTTLIDGVCTVTNKTNAGFVFSTQFSFSGDFDPANRTPIATYDGFAQGIEYNGTPTIAVPIPVTGVWINDAAFHDCQGILWISYGYICLSLRIPIEIGSGPFVSSSFNIPPFSISVPADIC